MNWNAVGALATAISVAFLAWQLFQANALQRKSMEEQYLRDVLSKAHAPCIALKELAIGLDHARAALGPGGAAPTVSSELAIYEKRMLEFATALHAAILVATTVQQTRGTAEYAAVLPHLHALTTAMQVSQLLATQLKTGMTEAQLVALPDFQDLVPICDAASSAIVRKLIALYDLTRND